MQVVLMILIRGKTNKTDQEQVPQQAPTRGEGFP